MQTIAADHSAAIADSSGRFFRTKQSIVHPIGCAHSVCTACARVLNCDGVVPRAFAKARVKEGTEL